MKAYMGNMWGISTGDRGAWVEEGDGGRKELEH